MTEVPRPRDLSPQEQEPTETRNEATFEVLSMLSFLCGRNEDRQQDINNWTGITNKLNNEEFADLQAFVEAVKAEARSMEWDNEHKLGEIEENLGSLVELFERWKK